jgi:hypothetical protein
LKNYALAALAWIWPDEGIALLVAPRYIIMQVRELLPQSAAILRWELITILGGVFLFFAAPELPYQWLWMVTAGGMIAKGGFLSIGRPYWRGPLIAWCVSREDVDYRFWGLGLCALAVLLLYELGWVGRSESRGIVGDMQNGSGCCAVPLGSP